MLYAIAFHCYVLLRTKVVPVRSSHVLTTAHVADMFCGIALLDSLCMGVSVLFVVLFPMFRVVGQPFSMRSASNTLINALVVLYVMTFSLVQLLLALTRELLHQLYLAIVHAVCVKDIKNSESIEFPFPEQLVMLSMRGDSF